MKGPHFFGCRFGPTACDKAAGLAQNSNSMVAAPPSDVRKASGLPSNGTHKGNALEKWAQPRVLKRIGGRPEAFRTSGGIAAFG